MFDFVWAALVVVCGAVSLILHINKISGTKEASIVFWVMLSVFLIRSFFWELYVTQGPSMSPTIKNHSLVMVDKQSYGVTLPLVEWAWHTRFPLPNDVVAFHQKSHIWIKRVVAVPGDVVEFIPHKGWFVNKKWIAPGSSKQIAVSTYLSQLTGRERRVFAQQWENGNVFAVVPMGHVFVLGDNAHHSTDSRSVGFIEMKNIVGQVYWRRP